MMQVLFVVLMLSAGVAGGQLGWHAVDRVLRFLDAQ